MFSTTEQYLNACILSEVDYYGIIVFNTTESEWKFLESSTRHAKKGMWVEVILIQQTPEEANHGVLPQ